MLISTLLIAALAGAQNPLPPSADLTLQPGAALTSPGALARGTGASDDFNRANGPMTGDWAQIVGQQEILNQAGYGGAGTGNQWMESTTADVAWDQAVTSLVFGPNTSGGLQYVAVVTGSGGTDNFYTKIQSQGSALYNYVGFYRGFNGGGWGTGGGFMAITPVDSGRMDVWYDPATDELVLDIDEFNDGSVDYTYTAANASAVGAGAGTGHGIGTYGSQVFDDWIVGGGSGGGPQVTVTGEVPGTVTVTVTGLTPGGLAVILFGMWGTTTVPSGNCAGMIMDLAAITHFILAADSSGTVSVSVQLPLQALGVGGVQAADLQQCQKSKVHVVDDDGDWDVGENGTQKIVGPAVKDGTIFFSNSGPGEVTLRVLSGGQYVFISVAAGQAVNQPVDEGGDAWVIDVNGDGQGAQGGWTYTIP